MRSKTGGTTELLCLKETWIFAISWVKFCITLEQANVTGSIIRYNERSAELFSFCDLAKKHEDPRGATRQS